MNKSNITSLVEEFNKTGITSSTHYIRSVENEIPIISNVIPEIYNSDFMKPYSPPKTFKKQVELLKSIQGYIDQIQELHLDTGSNGYLFQLNECHSNSEHLFNILKYLQKQKLVSKKDKVEIVFGYISMLIPFGTLVGNVMVECEHVILHEWHVWNYMNGCLIDLSLFHQGLSIDINAQISSWGKAQDHVFIMPPPNVAYLGRAFSDIHKFNSKVKKHFPQDPQQ